MTFGWSRSPGFGGVVSSSADHARCNTIGESAQLLNKGKSTMHTLSKVIPGTSSGRRRPQLPADGNCLVYYLLHVGGGGGSDAIFAVIFVDDYLLLRDTFMAIRPRS